MRHRFHLATLASFLLLSAALPAAAAEENSYTLTMKDHAFSPTTLEIPANTKVTLVIKNMDPTPEEFESKPLKREKVVAGGGTITLHVGPLKPGAYDFVGEYHEDVMKGQIVVK